MKPLGPWEACVGFIATSRFCRISCPKRLPADGVIYFLSWLEAEEGGYTPCTGCVPEALEWDSTLLELLERTRDWYRRHPGEPLTVVELSAWVGVSDRQLRRWFERRIGSSPKAFITGLALARSARLLSTTVRPVLDVALESGYSTVSAFNAAFRRHFGLSPRTYRQHKRR